MKRKPFLLGLTGSIGMGKSTTAEMFAQAGIPVWDADAAVHRLYQPGGDATAQIQNLWPHVVDETGVNRDKLKQHLAQHPSDFKRLENVVHPLVRHDREVFVTERPAANIILLDVPLLFETGGEKEMDAVVVVSVSPEIQRKRVLDRGTMTPEQFETILAKQVPDAEKRRRADFVIETFDMASARQSVQNVLAEIAKRISDARNRS